MAVTRLILGQSSSLIAQINCNNYLVNSYFHGRSPKIAIKGRKFPCKSEELSHFNRKVGVVGGGDVGGFVDVAGVVGGGKDQNPLRNDSRKLHKKFQQSRSRIVDRIGNFWKLLARMAPKFACSDCRQF